MTKPCSGEAVTRCVMPDTGAEITLAPPDILEELEIDENNLIPVLEENDVQGPSGERLQPIGPFKAHLSYMDYTTEKEIHICPSVHHILLAWYARANLGIIHQNFPEPLQCSAWAAENHRSVYQVQCSGPVTISDDPSASETEALRAELIERFSDVFAPKEELKPMRGDAMNIYLKENATQFALHAA